MIMCIQNLVKFCPSILKILSKKIFLTSIKGRNSVANLRKTTIYHTNIDHVNDKVYTKFELNSVHLLSRYWAKTNFWQQLRAVTLLNTCQKKTLYNINIDLVDDNVYTKFGWYTVHPFLRYWAKTTFLTSIKRCNSVANLQKNDALL